MQQYKWQGEVVQITFGYSEVNYNEKRALWWSNYECSKQQDKIAIIPSVRVMYRDKSFVIANHFGVAVQKLTQGGWPQYTHFSLSDAPFTSTQNSVYNIKKFDEKKYAVHEQARSKWQQKNFPQQYNQMQQLVAKIKK